MVLVVVEKYYLILVVAVNKYNIILIYSIMFNLNFKRLWAPLCYGGVGDGYLDSRRWQQFANSVQSLKDSPTTDCYLCAIALLCSRRVPHKSREKSSKSIKNFYQCIFISHGHEQKKNKCIKCILKMRHDQQVTRPILYLLLFWGHP